MTNPNTGAAEFCNNCRFFIPGELPYGECSKRPRLAQKWNDKTQASLWCQYWELTTVSEKIDNRADDIVNGAAAPETFDEAEQMRFEHEEELSPDYAAVIGELSNLNIALNRELERVKNAAFDVLLEGDNANLHEIRGVLRTYKSVIDGITSRIAQLMTE